MKEVKATDPYVSSRWRHEYPKIQILTVEQLLRGKRPDMPTTVSPFQEAPRVEKALRIPRQTKLPTIPKD